MAMPCPSCRGPLGLTLDFIIRNPIMQCPHCKIVLDFSGNRETAQEYLNGFKELEKLKKKFSKVAKFN